VGDTEGAVTRSRLRPCLCGFEAKTDHQGCLHRLGCALWKGRDKVAVLRERMGCDACPLCQKRVNYLGDGHAQGCENTPPPRRSLKGRHAKIVGGETALQAVLRALPTNRPEEPPVVVAQVTASRPDRAMFIFTLSCGHEVRRSRPSKQVICPQCRHPGERVRKSFGSV